MIKIREKNKFITYFFENMYSFTSDYFFGIIKTKYVCKQCRLGTYQYSNFCISIFELKNDQEFFYLMKDGYISQHNSNKNIEKYCERCLSNRVHFEFNQHYKMPSQLIISFLRGTNYEICTKIEFDEIIDFNIQIGDKRLAESEQSPTIFSLVACINRIFENGVEKFICFYFDYHQKVWKDSNGNQINNYINEIKNNGDIILLFYSEVY